MLSCIVLFNIYEITFTYTRNSIDAPAKSTPYTIPMIRSIGDILEKVSERQQRVQILRIIL